MPVFRQTAMGNVSHKPVISLDAVVCQATEHNGSSRSYISLLRELSLSAVSMNKIHVPSVVTVVLALV